MNAPHPKVPGSSYNPLRALRRFVELRSASRRILALEVPASRRRPAEAPVAPLAGCCCRGGG